MWTGLAIAFGAIWLLSIINDFIKKKSSEPPAAEDEGEFLGELPPIPKESMLDYDLHKVLSAEWLPSGMGPDHKPVAREYIRSMIVGEILLRVKPDAINPEALEYQGTFGLAQARKIFDAEVETHKKYLKERAERYASLHEIMNEYGITEDWILANGEFKPKPYDRPFVPFANPIGSITSSLKMHNADVERYRRDSMLTYNNHVFGTPLSYSSFDQISNSEIDLMIQFKDRLVARFLAPEASSTPPPLPEIPHPDEKYRPR